MKKEDLRIVFLGTPDFAVASLQGLVENAFNVVAVVTAPDKPVGRHGSILRPSPVKEYALSVGIPVLQPDNLKDPVFLQELKDYSADLQIVVAFRMLPEAVWNMPPKGTFNLHASLLPQYRGAAPINWAIINGEKETGVTTFFLRHAIDTGKIILQERIPIADTDDVEKLHDALMNLGSRLVVQTVNLIIEDAVDAVEQDGLYTDETQLQPAPKIFKETCQINWQNSMTSIYNFIRGLSPYPGAWTQLVNAEGEQTVLKVFAAEKVNEVHNLPVGSLRSNGKNTVEVAVSGGFLRLLSVQLAGKKRMNMGDFLNGFNQDIQSCSLLV